VVSKPPQLGQPKMLQFDALDNADDLGDFPTDRRVGLRLLWLADDPNARIDQITLVISADPALSVRILALANAPFFRKAGQVMSVSHAVSLLGAPTVRSLASTPVLQLFSSDCSQLPDRYWLHAITAAVAAARVASEARIDPAEALTAGLLHDFGEQLLRNRDPERFDELVQATSNATVPVRLRRERRAFGVDHATLGADVLRRQGLPSALTVAVREHHLVTEKATPLARVVHVADCVAKVIQGDVDLDVERTLREVGFDADGAGLVAQVESDRRALLMFLADFSAPSADRR
jgi:putative nucleotidyltransferase with HDIG domain